MHFAVIGICWAVMLFDAGLAVPLARTNKAVAIVSRAEWGARAAKNPVTLSKPVTYAFIHHTAGAASSDLASGKRVVKNIQNYHMDSNKWDDIGYSFLIGGDGTIFEGRGWNRVGAHTQGYNSNGYGIAFLGTFTSQLPTARAISSAKALIADAVSRGFLKQNYILKGHRQMGNTECPGSKLYQEIQKWANWKA
ncbi:peptidoglycan-recognition protein SC2-like [Paramacrobiotus metropolitanus]|uniref:peptidoglycan-recognition protein SC2-like n=1 Tax=Paramacrobiotus metropolitanus TaxID=2943436 RepID=UPI0024464BBD|nr:peptidoglycan-recognition protein SC2-like [Paramacrobiotus metropolitanus]